MKIRKIDFMELLFLLLVLTGEHFFLSGEFANHRDGFGCYNCGCNVFCVFTVL